jgi:alpha-L-rhamnosidase
MLLQLTLALLQLCAASSSALFADDSALRASGARPVWSPNATAQFVLLRRPFHLAGGAPKELVLHVSAQPIPNRLAGPRHGGSLASKLLCAYKLWVNGVPVGAGPGRPTGVNSTRENPALLYDSFDVSALLQRGSENVVAIEAFYWTAAQESVQVGCPPGESAFCEDGRSTDLDGSNPRDLGGVLCWLDGPSATAPLLHTGDGGWRVYADGDKALSVNHGVTNGQYHMPHEFYDMRHYPHGWRSSGYAPSSASAAAPHAKKWIAPRVTQPFSRMSSKDIPGIRMVTVAAASLRELPPSPSSSSSTAAGGGDGSCYVVDFGAIIQGGLDLTIVHGKAGQLVTVFAGEVLYKDGTVKWWEDNLNDTEFRAVWTLSEGRQTITAHEYKEARYWQVCGAGEPPTHDHVRGWRVWFPMGAAESTPDPTAGAVHSAVPTAFDPAVYSFVDSSSAQLNSVWELCRYTLRVAALDVNTDSNTRQRDPCNWDSHLQALGQAAIAPAASSPYRRRSLTFLFEPDARVMVWTEFYLFTLFATFAYSLESADLHVARVYFDRLAHDYALGQFVQPVGSHSAASLVVKDAGNTVGRCLYGNISTGACYYKDLIDWPNSEDALVAAGSPDRSCCRDGYVMNSANAPITAHAWAAHQNLAWLAAALGRPQAETSRYAATAAELKRGILSYLVRPASACDPPVGPCFADGLNETHTSVQSTMYVLGQGVLTPAEAQPYLPFLKAKSQPFPRCSAALSHFLFEALYTIAEGQPDSNEAADFAFELMARDGHRSWREMLSANATMTLEHWYGVNFQKHTWAHPWAAGPATHIVRRIFGVRPLTMGYETVAVHPQPPTNLTDGAMTLPTQRGEIAVSFRRSDGFFELRVVLPPSNTTAAHVCLPAALLPPHAVLKLDGEPAAGSRPEKGQLCLTKMLGGGSHIIVAAG